MHIHCGLTNELHAHPWKFGAFDVDVDLFILVVVLGGAPKDGIRWDVCVVE